MNQAKSKILIAGVGNPYRHDDGIGIEIIRILSSATLFPHNPYIDILDSGTDGFVLFDKLPSYKKVIIIDAVSMDESPGEVKVFSPEEAKIKIKKDALSTHGFGLAEVFKLAEEFAVETEIKIIGVEPKDINFGEGLSEDVKNKIPIILDLIKEIVPRHCESVT